jgi:ATP-dependent RNA helicase DHX37/DHR1
LVFLLFNLINIYISGRAGRVSPGHCYRLYSSNVYSEVFLNEKEPEIVQTPLDCVILGMMKMGLFEFILFFFFIFIF